MERERERERARGDGKEEGVERLGKSGKIVVQE